MNKVYDVFIKTNDVFDAMDNYIINLPPSRKCEIYKNSRVVKSRVKNKYDLLSMAVLQNTEYELNKSKVILEMSEIIVFCLSFYRENKELVRRYYAEKIESYPSHLRWLMMQCYINNDIDYVHYFEHIYKKRFTENRNTLIALTKDGVYDSIDNDKTSDIIVELIDSNIEFHDEHRHLPRKEYALMAASDETKIGIRMRIYDGKESDYVRYINKNYYVFDVVKPIMKLTLSKK